jgi:hypothetical protein
MTTPVTYVELNSPDLESTTSFTRDVFGWEPQPFAAPDYLVAACSAPATATRGRSRSSAWTRSTRCAIRSSQPPARSSSSRSRSQESAGGCYLTDPAGLLIGLHEYDSSA